jgi:endogenous inhibitor of DNA gyrase (YacG/DUF329 family)
MQTSKSELCFNHRKALGIVTRSDVIANTCPACSTSGVGSDVNLPSAHEQPHPPAMSDKPQYNLLELPICTTCGTQFGPSEDPSTQPFGCRICAVGRPPAAR